MSPAYLVVHICGLGVGNFRIARTAAIDFCVYKYLYISVTSQGSISRIKWEGDSKNEIRSWPKATRENIGGDLDRLERYEEPLDFRPMGGILPGVCELRDEDKDFWYRLFYWPHAGWIYVLHCFKKKTNQTSPGDMATARQRVKAIKQRNDAPARREGKNA